MMSLVSVVLFSICTYSGYTVITNNYNAYTYFIGAKLLDAPECMSIPKLFPFICTGKQNSAASFLDVSSFCIYDGWVLTVTAGHITSFLVYWGSFDNVTHTTTSITLET